MKRVLVIGCPGSGKSTFARKLRDVSGLPLHYLDMLWHLPDGDHVSQEEFDRRLEDILQGDEWIIDGNYSRTMERRMQSCDTVFLFDLPLEVCIAGVEARIGKPREDLPWQETEFDEEFRQWILEFPAKTLPVVYELLEKYREGREIVVFKTREEADDYLREHFSDK